MMPPKVIKNLKGPWGFDVYLHSVDEKGKTVKSYACTEHKPATPELDLTDEVPTVKIKI